MAKKGNAFDQVTFEFFDSLSDLEYLSRACDSQARSARQQAEQAMIEYGQQSASGSSTSSTTIGIASCLSIINVFGPEGGRFSHGRQSVHDEALLSLIDELGYRAQAQCVSLLYEAFENFLKRFSSILLFQKRNTWKLESSKRFHKLVPEFGKVERRNTAAYFEAYVQFLAHHNCDELLAELANKLDGCRAACKTSWFPDLFAIHRAVTCIRHTTVHCAGHPSQKALGRLQKWDRKMINELTLKSVLTGIDVIMPSVTATAILFEGIAGLAYCLYRLSTESCDMELSAPRR